MLLLWHIVLYTFASIGVLTVLLVLLAQRAGRPPYHYPPLNMTLDEYRDTLL